MHASDSLHFQTLRVHGIISKSSEGQTPPINATACVAPRVQNRPVSLV